MQDNPNTNISLPAGIESREIRLDDHRVHYLVAGSGPPVVLLHGGASDARDWVGTMTALAGRFTLYAPDFIGFGRSERKEAGYYLAEFFEFIEEFIKNLGLDNPAIVGHSFGGRIGVSVVARNRVKIRKLVLVDASGLGKISGFGSALFAMFAVIRRLRRRPQPFPRFLAKEGDDYNRVGDEALRRLEIPTLLVWNRRDPYFPVSLARRALKLIPEARLEVFPGYGHAPHMAHGMAFSRLLAEYLAGD